jgi:hypothetical protein
MRTCRLIFLLLLFVWGNPRGIVQSGSWGGAAPRGEVKAASISHVTPGDHGTTPSRLDAVQEGALLAAYGKFPLSFEANQGQADERVKFLARGSGYKLFLTNREAVLTLRTVKNSAHSSDPQSTQPDSPDVLRMMLVGANPSPKIVGVYPLEGKSNYFIGNDPAKWTTNLTNYAKVRYSNAYPGIDLVYYGNQQQLEYDFVVAPGAAPRAITLDLRADTQSTSGPSHSPAERKNVPLRIAPNGDLVVTMAEGGEIHFGKPNVYQAGKDFDPQMDAAAPELVAATHSISIDSRWVLRGPFQAGFEVGDYDQTKTLVIDPALNYSTYLGGSAYDAVFGVTVDSAGNAYVTGDTASNDFPTSNALQGAYGGNHDAFVAKLNLNGSALVYSTYLGGGNYDRAVGIAVDGAGNVYLAGTTGSPNFPVTAGALQTICGCAKSNNSDAFVSKLSPTGATLVYSTYLGGTANDYGSAIDVDSAGDAFVAGRTCSLDFPITAGSFQTTYGGGCSPSAGGDAYVSEVNATGSALVYSSYLGGSGIDAAYAIAVDASGSAYVAGNTNSTDFPATAGAFQTTNGGGYDSFVAKVNPTGSALVFASYLGGSADDTTWGIKVDSSGSAYLAGQTISPNFPTTTGAFQTSCGGGCLQTDGVVTKFSPTGSSLVYSTYLGGSGIEEAFAIAVDSAGEAFVTGETGSTNFPTTPGSFQPASPGGVAAYVTKLNSKGTKLAYSTYFGNTSTTGLAVAVNNTAHSFVVTGRTYSTTFPVTPGAFKTACPTCTQTNKASDGFVAEFIVGDQIWPLTLDFGNQVVGTHSTVMNTVLTNSTTGSSLHVATIQVTGANSADFVKTADTCGGPISGGAHCTISVTFTPSATGPESALLTVSDDAANTPQQVILQGTGSYVQLVPSSINFGKQRVGTQSGPQQITLTNTGGVALNITGITPTGINAGDFAQTNTCGSSVPAGGNCFINVTFTPTAKGKRFGAISITDDGGGSPQQVPLTGNGT